MPSPGRVTIVCMRAATLTDRGGDPARALRDLRPREAHHLPARNLELDVSLPIPLERRRRPVVGVAVHLDDEPPIPPDEINLDSLDADVRLGSRNAVAVAESEEAFLQFATGWSGCVA